MRSPELAAINAIQAILDGLATKEARRFVVRTVAEYEQLNQCRIVEFGTQPNQTVARVP